MANEKRLIDANALLSELQEELEFESPMYTADQNKWIDTGLRIAAYDVRHQPTVDAVEVVHGRWLYDSGSGKYFCSACDENALSFKKDTLYGGELYEVCLTDYCPNCGASMMDGDGNGS